MHHNKKNYTQPKIFSKIFGGAALLKKCLYFFYFGCVDF